MSENRSSPTSASSSSKWSCNTCTFDNYISASKCVMCRAPRLATSSIYSKMIATTTSSTTTAATTTTMSSSSSTPCEESTTKWSCDVCTYLNWPRSVKCVQCQTPRGAGDTHDDHQLSSLTEQKMRLSSPSVSRSNNRNHRNNRQQPQNQQLQDINAYQQQGSSVGSALSSGALNSGGSQSNASSAQGSFKWSCSVCTYENWPRAKVCVLCGARSPLNNNNVGVMSGNGSVRGRESQSPSPPHSAMALVRSGATALNNDEAPNTNNCEYERRVRQLRRLRIRDSDWAFLTACMGMVEGDMNPVEAYLNGGGQPTRKLTLAEVSLLNRPNTYELGYTLVHLAIRFHHEDKLATLLSRLESAGVGGGGGHVKCVPAYVAPDLAKAIRRHVSNVMRQRKANFACVYLSELATYSLPPEIDDLPEVTQSQLYSELLDREAQKELEENDVINWSLSTSDTNSQSEGCSVKPTRLFALWNRSAGDCLLDSVFQATWGVFDRDNALRAAMANTLQDASHKFYTRWREWELHQAAEMSYTVCESQMASEWLGLLQLASQPGSALEQIHVFALAHVLRRPIIVYGVKYVKSWRGENLGFAKFEGVYLPLLWESPSLCSRSPIVLGYTRGHFSALVPPEPSVDAQWHHFDCAGATNHEEKTVFLPLTTFEQKMLPVHFLQRSDLGHEQNILSLWMDVGFTDNGLMVARQSMDKPPLLVAQMTEEWLNHYRKLAQSNIAPFSSRPLVTALPSTSSNNGTGSSGSSVACSAGVNHHRQSSPYDRSDKLCIAESTVEAPKSEEHRVTPSSGNQGYSSDGDSEDE